MTKLVIVQCCLLWIGLHIFNTLQVSENGNTVNERRNVVTQRGDTLTRQRRWLDIDLKRSLLNMQLPFSCLDSDRWGRISHPIILCWFMTGAVRDVDVNVFPEQSGTKCHNFTFVLICIVDKRRQWVQIIDWPIYIQSKLTKIPFRRRSS